MNYAKVIDAALQLFPKKIHVTVINDITKVKIGNYKIALSQLPASFNKPTILEVEGKSWRVVKAQPAFVDEFSFTKKLTINILEKEQWQDERLKFNVPTRHVHHPLTTHTPLFHDFILDLSEDEWRQIEFLPSSALPVIQEEMLHIEPLLTSDNLFGFAAIHVREKTAGFCLQIEIADFCQTVQALKMGAVRIYGNTFVQNGIAIESANYTYYGIVAGDIITGVCQPVFEGINDEFMQVVASHDLVLVDWLEGRVLMADAGTEHKGVREEADLVKGLDISDRSVL